LKLYRKNYNIVIKLINTKKASELIGVNAQRVRQLITAGRLPAQKVGRDWIIRERDLAKVAHRRLGRPRNKRGRIKWPYWRDVPIILVSAINLPRISVASAVKI
jgi:excisionase family DNA binding protein